jgi:hypothetical protein
MMTLIAAAALAAQPAPAADMHAQHAQAPHGQMQPGQHEGMKKDCCKECCKDMGKHEDHADAPSKRGQ